MEENERAGINGLAIASLIFGALSLLTFFSMLLPVFNCVLAAVFSLLSRGNRKMSFMAVTGLVLGITGLVLGLFVALVAVSWVQQIWKSPELGNTLGLIFKNLFLFYGTGGAL